MGQSLCEFMFCTVVHLPLFRQAETKHLQAELQKLQAPWKQTYLWILHIACISVSLLGLMLGLVVGLLHDETPERLLPNGKDSQLSLSLTAHSTIDAKREWHRCKLFCHILSFVLLLYILASWLKLRFCWAIKFLQPNKKLSRSRPMLKQCHRGSLHNTTLVLGPALSH